MIIIFNYSESSNLKIGGINPLILLLLISVFLLFQACGGDDEETPTINNYYTDCEENASEPPIPTYATIEKKHLSHLSYTRVIGHERDGDFLTYSAEGARLFQK
ncbi:hypothetical protein JT359_14115 [Candidatus Poribacteria bacterium]|nr:hypothetical protein [Candidatus Poribacteria bacterium]